MTSINFISSDNDTLIFSVDGSGIKFLPQKGEKIVDPKYGNIYQVNEVIHVPSQDNWTVRVLVSEVSK